MSNDSEPVGDTKRNRRPSEGAIFSAALEAFSANGFNGTSMRDIAGRAGTSLSNLYNYVPAKADLLAHVLQRANDDLLGVLHESLTDPPDSAKERLGRVVRAYVGWSVIQKTAGVVAMSEFRYLEGPLREQVVEARDRTQHIFTDIVVEGAAAGEFGTPFPQEAARNIVLLCAALATWYHPGGGRTSAELADEQARLALAMVEAGI